MCALPMGVEQNNTFWFVGESFRANIATYMWVKALLIEVSGSQQGPDLFLLLVGAYLHDEVAVSVSDKSCQEA